jgi:hypothetical protein
MESRKNYRLKQQEEAMTRVPQNCRSNMVLSSLVSLSASCIPDLELKKQTTYKPQWI